MKGKILSSLKTKYAHLGLGDNILERMAESLAPSVTSEEQIETAVSGVESYLKLMQTEFDKFRNEKSGLQKELDKLQKDAEARRKAEEEAKKKAEEETAKKAEEEARRKAEKEANEGNTPPAETTEQIVARLLEANNAKIAKSYEEKLSAQQAEIKTLTDRLKADDEARQQAERAADFKARAKNLGIATAYDSVVASFIATSKDADDFESKIKSFKQSLTDDGSKSATPPDTPQQKQEKENEAIASLINEGTRKIVEQSKK